MDKKLLSAFYLALLMLLFGTSISAREIKVYLFHQPGCSNCAIMEEFLHSMEEQFPGLEIVDLNLMKDFEANIKYEIAVRQFQISSAALPLVLMGEYYYIGARPKVLENIAFAISTYQALPYEDLVGMVINGEIEDASGVAPPPMDMISLPIIGDIRLGALPLIASTAVIAFVDGFNPCSLWVLSLVLGMALHAGKRLHVFSIGFIFLIITSLVYGGFLFGAVQVVEILTFSTFLRILLIVFIAVFAVINLKDYFAWKEGVSLTMGDKGKSSILAKIRRLLNPSRGILPLIVGTIVLAFSAALIELPCTAGFPVLWAQLLAGAVISEQAMWAYLALYLLVYLIDEILVLLIVVITLRRQMMDEKKGRVLKLISGSLMTTIMVHLLFFPNFMRSGFGILSVIGVTVLIIFLMMIIRQRYSRRTA